MILRQAPDNRRNSQLVRRMVAFGRALIFRGEKEETACVSVDGVGVGLVRAFPLASSRRRSLGWVESRRFRLL